MKAVPKIMAKRILGRLGVWLCDHCYPRPATFSEHMQSQQYVHLMIDVLKGQVPYYARDRGDLEPIVADKVR